MLSAAVVTELAVVTMFVAAVSPFLKPEYVYVRAGNDSVSKISLLSPVTVRVAGPTVTLPFVCVIS